MRRLLRFLSRDFLDFSDFTSSGTAGWAANRSLNFLFTVRSGTTRERHRTMAEFAWLGPAFTRIPMLKPLGRATNHGGQKNGEPRERVLPGAFRSSYAPLQFPPEIPKPVRA